MFVPAEPEAAIVFNCLPTASQASPIPAVDLDRVTSVLNVLCRRLDSIAKGELNRTVPDFLRDFEDTVATGALRTAMDTLPLDPAAQLDVVLRLAGLLLHRSNIRPRFVECVQAFTAGIGSGPGATLQSLTARYSLAHDRFYEPFFRRQPHIMENYLINTIVRCQFPFGADGMSPNTQPSYAQPSRSREFALLAAQFALMKGLLIGVAGFHGEAFSAAQVVHTVQAASKHFEHHPEFLKMSHELLVESRMDGARGLAFLLRNAGPEIASNLPRPVSPSIHVPESRALEPKP
jgi:lysine-N-methylase